MVTEIKFKEIIDMLNTLPKEKVYTTDSIQVARGRYRYKGSLLKRLKKLIYG
jgi:hypothetical protein